MVACCSTSTAGLGSHLLHRKRTGAGNSQRQPQATLVSCCCIVLLSVFLACVLSASPNTPLWWPTGSSVQLNLAMAVLEAAALLYLNELLPDTARRAMGVVMRLAPKAAAVLAAFAVQPHARLPDRPMLQAGSMANAHVPVGGELVWYSALYAVRRCEHGHCSPCPVLLCSTDAMHTCSMCSCA